MSIIDFKISAVKSKPKKMNAQKVRSRKYQPIIDEFLKSGFTLARVDNMGLSGLYLATVLNRVIKKKGFEKIIISVRNQAVYLENAR